MSYKYRIKYNGTTLIDNLDTESIYSNTLSCSGKYMGGDIVVETYKTSRLPEGYTEVEYIASTGTQYIDTGIAGNAIGFFSGKVMFTKMDAWIFNAKGPSTLSNSGEVGMGTGHACYWCPVAGGWNNTTGSASLNTEYTVTLSTIYNSVTMSVNGTTYSPYLSDNTSDRTTYSLYLFAQNAIGSASIIGTLRIYSAQFYSTDKTTLLANFVPCINPDNVVGMYDLTRKAFYGNSGSGVFTAGPEV